MASLKRLSTLALLLLAACGSPAGPGPAASPLPPAELRYAVLARTGPSWEGCGPPVEFPGWAQQQADAQFPNIQAEVITYTAILAHSRPPGGPADSAFRLAVWQQWRQLNAVRLTPAGTDSDFQVALAPSGARLARGTVTATGVVRVTSVAPVSLPPCPICLTEDTLIATPDGDVAVAALLPGRLVWTLDAEGRRLAAPVLAVGHVPFPAGHHALKVRLSDGRQVTASASHPLPDGRPLGALAPGMALDGSTVESVEQVHLDDGGTWDLLPAGPTGLYWAGGILLASTIGDR